MRRVSSLTFVILLLAAAVAAQEQVLYFPAAASAEGVNDTFWSTDAWIYNPDAANPLTVQLAWLRANQDNRGVPEVAVEVGPRQAVAIADLVGGTLGASGAGAVRLRANRSFMAASRTFNSGSAECGTFGQFIPAVGADRALTQGLLLGVVNQPSASGFRSNVGLVNVQQGTTTITVRVFDAGAGVLEGERELSLPPLAYRQINDVFDFVGIADEVLPNATVEISASGAVLAYVSVVENTSGDAVFALAAPDTGTPQTANNPPDAQIVQPSGNVTIEAGDDVAFIGSASDPDGDAVSVVWDFGDGITSSQLEPEHTFSDVGQYMVTLTATDEHGLADPTPASVTVTVSEGSTATFTEVQSRIFTPSCAFAGCHGGSSPQQGMNLSAGQAYANIVNVPSTEQPSRDRIEPGSPSESYLYLKVTGDSSITGSQMPLGGGELSPELIELLRDWIEAGAPND